MLDDDGLKRRKVALVDGGTLREGLDLLSPAHYLRQALKPSTDLIEGTLADLLPAAPDVVILADVARLQQDDADRLADWVDQGGLLVRFAGPRLAASLAPDAAPDPLLPVPLRPGDRAVGGAMSWGAPQGLAPFPEGSPFAGLAVPAEVTVSAQVLAQPSPELASHVIAALADGTPLVTRAQSGAGQLVLFHVSANAEWTSLPLSGLFVEMLDRLAISSHPGKAETAALAGTRWQAERVMDGFGHLAKAAGLAGVAGEALGKGVTGPELPPGLYRSQDRQRAVNVMAADRVLAPAVWPAGVHIEGLARMQELPLRGGLLAAALLLLIADILATLFLSGRLGGLRRAGVLVVMAALAGTGLPPAARAQTADADGLAAAADAA
ncbi:MAG: LytTR family transcriptional regulator, partial [Rhodobacteraceae bacterium]|nr:LytTR family transcriptional regulator [Paracoccaceae bacterium]